MIKLRGVNVVVNRDYLIDNREEVLWIFSSPQLTPYEANIQRDAGLYFSLDCKSAMQQRAGESFRYGEVIPMKINGFMNELAMHLIAPFTSSLDSKTYQSMWVKTFYNALVSTYTHQYTRIALPINFERIHKAHHKPLIQGLTTAIAKFNKDYRVHRYKIKIIVNSNGNEAIANVLLKSQQPSVWKLFLNKMTRS